VCNDYDLYAEEISSNRRSFCCCRLCHGTSSTAQNLESNLLLRSLWQGYSEMWHNNSTALTCVANERSAAAAGLQNGQKPLVLQCHQLGCSCLQLLLCCYGLDQLCSYKASGSVTKSSLSIDSLEYQQDAPPPLCLLMSRKAQVCRQVRCLTSLPQSHFVAVSVCKVRLGLRASSAQHSVRSQPLPVP